MSNPNSNLDPNFESTQAQSSVGWWYIQGVDSPVSNYRFNPPINPADYRIPDREKGRIEIIDRGPVFQYPATQDGNTYTFSWPYASYAWVTGIQPFELPNAYGEKPRVLINDAGFNVVSGINCEITNLHYDLLPGHMDPTGNLRYSVSVDFITRS